MLDNDLRVGMNSFPISKKKSLNKYWVYRTGSIPYGYNRNSR